MAQIGQQMSLTLCFNFLVDELVLDESQSIGKQSENDPTKNVKQWLDNSQNIFSAPFISSEAATQDGSSVEHLISEVQIHSNTKKVVTSEKIIHKYQPQDDWEKIESMPEMSENNKKNCNNNDEIISFETEACTFNNNEYTTNNPRRSSRKRELKNDESLSKTHDMSVSKCSSKNSSSEIEKQSLKNKQKWGNVKRMRQEFSKLNKKNRNKLNVSIEMCKKMPTGMVSKNDTENTGVNAAPEELEYVIEDNTPYVVETEKEVPSNIKPIQPDLSTNVKNNEGSNISNQIVIESNSAFEKESGLSNVVLVDKSNILNNDITQKKKNNPENLYDSNIKTTEKVIAKMPFIKKGALCVESIEKADIKTFNYNIDCTDSAKTDNIEITIKVGNTVTNILIKKQKSDVETKINIDQEIQASLGPYVLNHNESPINMHKENECRDINSEHLEKEQEVTNGAKKCESQGQGNDHTSSKSLSTKKNTASADTATVAANFEITESVEKELSSVMECVESTISNNQNECINNYQNLDSHQLAKEDDKDPNTQLLPPSNVKLNTSKHTVEKEYIDDLDIFDSGSVKETNIQLLKHTHHTPSEIFMPTIKSNKGRIQKQADKRNRDICEDTELPSKKQKTTQNVIHEKNDNVLDNSARKDFGTDSEIMNYDAIMGQVFANIDTDIHDSQKEINVTKSVENMQQYENNQNNDEIVVLSEDTQIQSSLLVGNTHRKQNERYSENIFTVVDKEDDTHDSLKTNVKVSVCFIYGNNIRPLLLYACAGFTSPRSVWLLS